MRMPSKSLMRLRRLWVTNPQSVKIPKTPNFRVGRFLVFRPKVQREQGRECREPRVAEQSPTVGLKRSVMRED